MGLFGSKNQASAGSVTTPPSAPASGGLMTTKTVAKGESTLMTRKSGGGDEFTLIATWGKKDYDLYCLVEYLDGHVEVVSCFGTTRHPKQFSLQTEDGCVKHVSGDKVAGGKDLPQELISIRLTPKMRSIVPVVYSAKNSGAGSFYRYRVSTFVVRGTHQTVPTDQNTEMVHVDAVDANRDDAVYTFVPAVIHVTPQGANIEAVELYSRRGSELRPTVNNGKVSMDTGEENSNK